ncbi:amino acid ABC transporter ATP-binding protein [Terrisporobacter petrolearius]|uniref:amino acid ABC transporter ATP-binding protein n=1 Tax=Terrisporobacter petrolearius TaxID=1460447 RepID=UPI001D165BD0|nr:amino acid ABC transporter ATP-binding protein [Terrisporobacter petrolearius]
MIKLENVHKSYDKLDVIKGISLDIKKGEIISLVGASGSGKSTLVRCINGLEKIQGGNIYIRGEKVNSHNSVAGRVGMVFQNFNLFPHYTVINNIVNPLVNVRGIKKDKAKKMAESLLEKVKLGDKANYYPNELSGGQKQRVAIARALSMEPEIILFDEPTSSLDPQLSFEVFKTIKQLVEEGYTMVIVTHEIKMALDISTRVVFLDKGKIYFDGKPNEFYTHESERLKDFLENIII